MKAENDSNTLRMVDRACKILDYIYNIDEAASISTLSKELELPKANVFRILYTLQQNGMIQKASDSDLYRLGNKMIEYGEKVRHDFSIVDVCKADMLALAQDIGESVNLGIVHEGHIITIHSEEGEKTVLVSRLIPIAEPHCSSMGKIHLAHLNDSELSAYFSKDLDKRTVNTITQQSVFKKEQAEILKQDMAFDHEEYEYGLSCMATPLRSQDGQIIAMLSVSGPTSRLEFKGMNEIINKLKITSSSLSKRLNNTSVNLF